MELVSFELSAKQVSFAAQMTEEQARLAEVRAAREAARKRREEDKADAAPPPSTVRDSRDEGQKRVGVEAKVC